MDLSQKYSQTFRLEKWEYGRHFFRVGDELAAKFLKDGHYRVVCTIANETFHCAIMPKKEGGYFISLGVALCKKLNLSEGDEFDASLQLDTSTYAFHMPEELNEVLVSDPEAFEVFHSLTEGNQRGLIYLVNQVKSIEKRIERALTIAQKIKMGVTSPQKVLR